MHLKCPTNQTAPACHKNNQKLHSDKKSNSKNSVIHISSM